MRVPTALVLLVAALVSENLAAAYDPTRPGPGTVVGKDFEVLDAGRDREIPLRVYVGKAAGRTPVILFSHGLGGWRENNRYLANHWASHGYAVVVMQHAGSDRAVWQGLPMAERTQALKKAVNRKNFLLRVADVRAVLDQLEDWNEKPGHALEGRLDPGRVGMSGHSFGAVTTQAVSGQVFGRRGKEFTDSRIDAAVAFSPSVPAVGDPGRAFGTVALPWLLMTGTKDRSLVRARTTPESRLEVFRNLPAGSKYQLVLDGAEHMAFSDRTLTGGAHRNPNHHRAIQAITTAFWDAHLKDERQAVKWLDGEGPRGVLEAKDRWESK